MPEDPYLYPGTSVLRNRLGLRDPAALAAAESRLSALADAELAAEPIRGSFDLAHLQAIHRALFSDVYDWAGELRTVAIAKADMFCLPQHIASYAADIFVRLGRERHLAGLGREQFIGRLSVYLGDVNALHAFPRGQRPRAARLYAARPRGRLPARLVRGRSGPQRQRVDQRHARAGGAAARTARGAHHAAAGRGWGRGGRRSAHGPRGVPEAAGGTSTAGRPGGPPRRGPAAWAQPRHAARPLTTARSR